MSKCKFCLINQVNNNLNDNTKTMDNIQSIDSVDINTLCDNHLIKLRASANLCLIKIKEIIDESVHRCANCDKIFREDKNDPVISTIVFKHDPNNNNTISVFDSEEFTFHTLSCRDHFFEKKNKYQYFITTSTTSISTIKPPPSPLPSKQENNKKRERMEENNNNNKKQEDQPLVKRNKTSTIPIRVMTTKHLIIHVSSNGHYNKIYMVNPESNIFDIDETLKNFFFAPRKDLFCAQFIFNKHNVQEEFKNNNNNNPLYDDDKLIDYVKKEYQKEYETFRNTLQTQINDFEAEDNDNNDFEIYENNTLKFDFYLEDTHISKIFIGSRHSNLSDFKQSPTLEKPGKFLKEIPNEEPCQLCIIHLTDLYYIFLIPLRIMNIMKDMELVLLSSSVYAKAKEDYTKHLTKSTIKKNKKKIQLEIDKTGDDMFDNMVDLLEYLNKGNSLMNQQAFRMIDTSIYNIEKIVSVVKFGDF